MAGSSGYVAGTPVNLYYRSGATLTASGSQDWSGLNGAGKLVLAANLIVDVTELGDQEESANTSSTAVYGKDTEISVAAPASLPEWTFTCLLDNTNAIHQALVGLANGTNVEFGVLTNTGANNQTLDYIRGTIASVSKSTPVDSPQTFTIAVAQTQKIVRVNQA